MQRSVSVEVVDDSTTVPVGLMVAGYDVTVSDPCPCILLYITPHCTANIHFMYPLYMYTQCTCK